MLNPISQSVPIVLPISEADKTAIVEHTVQLHQQQQQQRTDEEEEVSNPVRVRLLYKVGIFGTIFCTDMCFC